MKYFKISEYDVSFNQVNHAYYVDGVAVASVSDIVDEMFPRSLGKVDPDILKKAAERGTELRDMIETYERYNQKTYHKEMQGYLALKTQHQFDVLENEVIVLLHHHGVVIAAGTFDMIVRSPYIKGQGIVDVKRAAHIDEKRLTLQLNLYKLGYEQTYKEKINYLKCIHIRNRYHRYLDIPKNKEFTKETLDKYIEKHPIDYTRYL